jgi:hypothetical protein
VAGGRAALHSAERLLHVPQPATSSPLPQPTAAPGNGECSGDDKAAGGAAARDGRGEEAGGDTAAACSAVGCGGGVRRPPVGDGSEAATGGEG